MKVKEELSKEDLYKLLNASEINLSEKMQPSKVALQIMGGKGLTNIGTFGNFSLIIGKAKSRKTFLMTLLFSAIIKDKVLFAHIIGHLTQAQPVVLYFDTEQSRYDVQRTVKRICKLARVDVPANLHVYSLRKYHPAIRLQLIERAIYSNDKIGFVGIDGLRDLVSAINDEEQATLISSKLLRWTEERNIHIICVLHQNKGDYNARGHLGTELVNKAETVLSVTKPTEKKDISVVEAEYCRDKDPEPFAFEVDSEGLPRVLENWARRASKDKNNDSIQDIEPNKAYQIIKDSFSKIPLQRYSELRAQIKLSYNKLQGASIGDNKAKEFITFCMDKNWIKQEKDKGPYSLKDQT